MKNFLILFLACFCFQGVSAQGQNNVALGDVHSTSLIGCEDCGIWQSGISFRLSGNGVQGISDIQCVLTAEDGTTYFVPIAGPTESHGNTRFYKASLTTMDLGNRVSLDVVAVDHSGNTDVVYRFHKFVEMPNDEEGY